MTEKGAASFRSKGLMVSTKAKPGKLHPGGFSGGNDSTGPWRQSQAEPCKVPFEAAAGQVSAQDPVPARPATSPFLRAHGGNKQTVENSGRLVAAEHVDSIEELIDSSCCYGEGGGPSSTPGFCEICSCPRGGTGTQGSYLLHTGQIVLGWSLPTDDLLTFRT